MKKSCAITVLLAILIWSLSIIPRALAPDDIASRAVVLMDGETGQVLYQKNMDQQMYPASTTKIMTALLAVENTIPSDYVTVSESALDIDEPNSSNVGLEIGEKLTVQDTLYGLMLRSANEAANVLAEYIAGSQEAFAKLMTERAREIGAVNTSFANPHGLHDPEHYTTAYDLALITRYAASNEDFSRYYSTPEYQMQPTNMHPEARTISNHLYMLFDYGPYYNETVIGGKTGFTDEAKNTLSTVSQKDGRTLVCVVMYSEAAREKFDDTTALLEYGFDSFYPYTVSADAFSEFSVPVGTQDNPVGNAFLSYNQDITLYLPAASSPEDLQIEYERADIFASEEDVSGYITFSLPTNAAEGLPTVLLRIPMDISVAMDAVPTMALPEEGNSGFVLPALFSTIASYILPFIGLTVGIAAILFLLLLLVRFINVRRVRKQRIARMERVRQRQRDLSSAPAETEPTSPPIAVRGAPHPRGTTSRKTTPADGTGRPLQTGMRSSATHATAYRSASTKRGSATSPYRSGYQAYQSRK